jgi:hypothetical protein
MQSFLRLHEFPRKVEDPMNARRAVMPVVCLLVVVGLAFAQQSVDPGSMYARIYAIVPMIGSGTWDDPTRPMYAPVPQQMTPGSRTGIIAFNQVLCKRTANPG